MGKHVPYGLAVRIPGFHPGGPGSTPGMGTACILKHPKNDIVSLKSMASNAVYYDERSPNIVSQILYKIILYIVSKMSGETTQYSMSKKCKETK